MQKVLNKIIIEIIKSNKVLDILIYLDIGLFFNSFNSIKIYYNFLIRNNKSKNLIFSIKNSIFFIKNKYFFKICI
jgi:hypothetical protein